MAQITVKRSSVEGKIPLTTDLQLGELAINTYDGKLFLKRNNGLADYVVEIGGNTGFDVKNQTGSTLTKGTLVAFAGTLGSSGKLLVQPFLADGTTPSDYFMGVVLETIPNGGDGFVVDHGKIYGMNTSAYAADTVLYASATTAGAFTSVRPQAPNNKITVAAVVNSSTSAGVLEVRVTLGSQLGNDELVELSTLNAGDTLAYNATTARFENTPLKTVNGTSLLGTGDIAVSYSSELQNRYSYTATALQTTFAATYTAPYVDVYQNGVRLGTADYVATTGTNIVLTVGAAADDLIEIIGHKTFGVADAYTQAETDALLATKQATLVSGTNIKTINGESVVGSGDLELSGGLAYVVKTANYTVQDKQGVLADTTAGSFTVTLPASPAAGAQVVVADAGGAWSSNNLTVARNGSTIENLSEDLILDINGVSVTFIYTGTTWQVYAQVGGTSGTNSLDGGFAASEYLSLQFINGGTANG